MPQRFLLLFLLGLICCACQIKTEPLLSSQLPEKTGVDFQNTLVETDSFNIVAHEYIYNGGGVGVSDFDGNGLPDLFFTGNRVSCELYLQKEPWQFEKVTIAAGLNTSVWCAGVSVVDIDGNGYEDIYLSTLNLTGERNVPNLLFLNQGPGPDGIPKFIESAQSLGLADSSYCTQAAWLDIDLDGDLDLYQLNNGIEKYNRNVPRGPDTVGRGNSLDVLYRNEGNGPDGTPRFIKMPLSFGIKQEGWGLGVAIHDFNNDGYPDIYAANDFISNDLLWINQQGKGFKEEGGKYSPHFSYNSMGVDIADLNNDGLQDMMVVDMLPDDNSRIKSMFPEQNYDKSKLNLLRGYRQQYVRNVLQLNNGDGTFSDIGQLTGTAGTDWSWCPLFFDIDNDGLRDLYITNGYPKDITDLDFANYNMTSTMFGDKASKKKTTVDLLKDLGGVHQPNFVFHNEGGLSLTNEVAKGEWVNDDPSYANGAVYVDLDLDGDLDLVTNNINEPAVILRNLSRERQPENSNYLSIELKGSAVNPGGIGAEITVSTVRNVSDTSTIDESRCDSTFGGSQRTGFGVDNQKIYHEHYRVKGYLSTLGPNAHFGLGCYSDRLTVDIRWPDGKTQQLTNIAVNQLLTINYQNANGEVKNKQGLRINESAFQEIPYAEKDFNDFNFQYLLLRKYSEEGPVLLSADFDEDGTDELVVGGPAGVATKLFKWQSGRYELAYIFEETLTDEASFLLVEDLNEDGNPDLYQGSGSGEDIRRDGSSMMDHAYFNKRSSWELGYSSMNGFSTAGLMLDINQDGNPDLFTGGRILPGQFPRAAASSLNLWDSDKLYTHGPPVNLGIIADAVKGDFDGDGVEEIITAGDFNTIKLLRFNTEGRMVWQTDIAPSGWWQSLIATDYDGDGDLDIFAGNTGSNGALQASKERPIQLVADDFDKNGSIDPIVTAYTNGVPYPVHPRNTYTKQLPGERGRFSSFALYGQYRQKDLPSAGDTAIRLEITELNSVYLENDGAGNFSLYHLPAEVQLSPVRAWNSPALGVVYGLGNDYAFETIGGAYDAGTGFSLSGQPGNWEVSRSAIDAGGDVHALVRLRTPIGQLWAVGGQEGIRLLKLNENILPVQ